MKLQCLWYALDKWKAEGGYLMFRRSTHWHIPHVLHLSKEDVLTHYVPPKDLKYPWMAAFGFNGNVIENDPSPAEPMHPLAMFTGSMLLFILGGLWAVRCYLNKIKNILRQKHDNHN